MFRITFEKLKNTFNTTKIYLKKKKSFDKKIKSTFKGLKSLKTKVIFNLKTLFFKYNLKHALRSKSISTAIKGETRILGREKHKKKIIIYVF
jgi:hypothetical protein